MSSLLRTSLYSIILGCLLGVLYDCVRIIRLVVGVSKYSDRKRFERLYEKGLLNVFKPFRSGLLSNVIVALTDIIFFVISSVVFVLFLYCFNHGIFRWFILVSCIIGFRIYYLTFGKIVISLSDIISDCLKFIINIILFVLVIPFRIVFRAVLKVFNGAIRPLLLKIAITIDKRRSKRYTLKCIDSLSYFVFNG